MDFKQFLRDGFKMNLSNTWRFKYFFNGEDSYHCLSFPKLLSAILIMPCFFSPISPWDYWWFLVTKRMRGTWNIWQYLCNTRSKSSEVDDVRAGTFPRRADSLALPSLSLLLLRWERHLSLQKARVLSMCHFPLCLITVFTWRAPKDAEHSQPLTIASSSSHRSAHFLPPSVYGVCQMYFELEHAKL